MAESLEQRESAVVSSTGEPGPLSRLLQELADASGEDALDAWKNELQPGDRVGRFEIRREVGRGGFGAVYEAFDTELNRVVAVKTLRLTRPRRDLSSDWIKKEAEAVARLDHPCIVTLFDVGTCESGPYLVMELLRGKTLAERIAEGPIAQAEALRIAEEVAKGLAHAHQRGVLHRDLKPANVFLCEDGRVKLLDFGLAHLLGTEGGSSGGTPTYMAPEQWTGSSGTAASDVFALGVLLHRMFTGELPPPDANGGRDTTELGKGPPLPRSAGPRPLRELVARCLSPDPAQRPANGAAVLEALTKARRDLERRKTTRRLRRAAGALLVVGLAALAAFHTWRRGEPSGPAVPVVVADFENTTGDPELDALSGLLITSLQQSSRLAVLPRWRVLEIARASRGGEVSRVDDPTGREVARRTGTRALMLPTVRKLDDTYVVELRGVEPEGDRILFAVEERGQGKASLPDLVDRLSARSRKALHERTEDVQRSQVQVGRAVTSDLGAYEHYFRGQQLLGEGKDGEALAAFRRAVEIEPGFALAHLAAAGVLEGSDPDGSRASIAAAMRHMDRAPEKERLLIQAWNAALQYRTEEALPYLEEIQRRWPDDPDGWSLAGTWIATQRGDWARALPLLERGAALDPARTPTVIRAQLRAHRFDDALATARRFAVERPGIPSLILLTLTHSHRGETEEAAEAARRALQAGSSLQEVILHALLRAGALDEAEEAARTWSAPSREEIHRRDAYVSRAVIRSVEGRQREALAIVDEIEKDLDGGEPAPYTLWVRSFLLGGSGRCRRDLPGREGRAEGRLPRSDVRLDAARRPGGRRACRGTRPGSGEDPLRPHLPRGHRLAPRRSPGCHHRPPGRGPRDRPVLPRAGPPRFRTARGGRGGLPRLLPAADGMDALLRLELPPEPLPGGVGAGATRGEGGGAAPPPGAPRPLEARGSRHAPSGGRSFARGPSRGRDAGREVANRPGLAIPSATSAGTVHPTRDGNRPDPENQQMVSPTKAPDRPVPEIRGAILVPPDAERAFRDGNLRSDARLAAMAIAVVTFSFGMFGWGDFLFAETRQALVAAVSARAAFVLVGIAAIWSLLRARRPVVLDRWAVAWSAAYGFRVVFQAIRPADHFLPLLADVAVAMSLWLMFQAGFRSQVLASGLVTTGTFAWLIAFRTRPPYDGWALIITIWIVANGIGAYGSWLVHRQRRAGYLDMLRLAAAEKAALDRDEVRRKSEEALQRKEEQLARVLEGSSDGFWDLDVKGRRVLMSARYNEIIGRPPDMTDVPLDELIELIEPEDQAQIRIDMPALRSGEKDRFTWEYRVRVPGKGLRWVQVRGKVADRDPGGTAVRISGTITDIHERKSYEWSLRESEARFRRLANEMPIGIFQANAEGVPIFINQTLRAMTGASQLGGYQPGASDVVHPEDKERVFRVWHDAVSKGTSYSDEYRFLTPAGRTVWVRSIGKPLHDESGAVTGFVGAIVDITEARSLEAQLSIASRLAALGTLVAGLAHELNNPLAAELSGQGLALEIARDIRKQLQEGPPVPPEAKLKDLDEVIHALEDAQEAGQRIAKIVRDMALFASPSATRSAIRLKDAVADGLRWLPKPLLDSADVEVDDRGAPEVLASGGQIAQIVSNLVSNALKATRPGTKGKVVVRIGTGDAGRAILEVIDEGVGVAPQHRPNVFDPFFTTRPVGEGRGSGLGLAVTHAIVASHEGTITVESEVGKGSTFRVELPAAPAEA